jgi:hypothetical protein
LPQMKQQRRDRDGEDKRSNDSEPAASHRPPLLAPC